MSIIVWDNNLNWPSEKLYFDRILWVHHHVDMRMKSIGKKSKLYYR